MDTPEIDGPSQAELLERLARVETNLATLEHLQITAQEERESLQRALGCFILNDKRGQYEADTM